MLVEINLLTAKEKKDVTKWFLAAIIFIFLFSSIITLKIINDRVQKDIDALESKRAVVLEELAEKQQISEEKPVSFPEQLETTIKILEKEVIPGSELLREIVRLLPEHGYLIDFNFDHPTTVTFQARFDQISAVAAYNYALTQSQYIDSVLLYSISTETIDTEPEPANQTAQGIDLGRVQQVGQSSEPVKHTGLEAEPIIAMEPEFLPRYVAYFELKVNRSAFLGRGYR